MKYLILLLLSINAFALNITSHTITWTISGTPASGTFANGDPWVVGPITITAITRPNGAADRDGSMFIGGLGGWGSNGFDSRIENLTYNAGLNVANSLPLVVDVNKSLVSSISHPALRRTQLDYQAVLTVLPSAPPAGSFRPCYAGTNKAITHNKSQIDYTKLQNLDPVSGTPTFAELSDTFKDVIISVGGAAYVGVNYCTAWFNCPHDGNNYGGGANGISFATSRAALLLNLNYTNAQKEELAIRFIQYGLDIHFGIIAGMRYHPEAGHNDGRKIPMLMAGILLNDSAILAAVNGSNGYFSEDRQHFYVSQNDINLDRYVSATQPAEPYPQSSLGMPEWGPAGGYPNNTAGYQWGRAYRQVCGRGIIGTPLAVKIMGKEAIWNQPAFIDYISTRYVPIEHDTVGVNKIDSWMLEMWDTYWDEDPPDETQARTPVAIPGGSGYNSPQSVTISSGTAGATIYYTTDGSTPTSGSTLYTAPVTISETTTLKAIATKAGLTDSAVMTQEYVFGPYFSTTEFNSILLPSQTADSFTVSWIFTPSATPMDGAAGLSQTTVTEWGGMGPIVRFASSGNIDARNGDVYAAVNTLAYSAGVDYLCELTVNRLANTYSVTVTPEGGSPTVIATDYGFRTTHVDLSAINYLTIRHVGGSSFALDDVTFGTAEVPCLAPTFSPVSPGIYSTAQSVTIVTNEAGGTTRYTTDGSDPTSSSTAYSAPLSVTVTTTIKARTFKAGNQQSPQLSGTFTIEEIVVDPEKVQPVLVDIAGGTYESAQNVTPTTNTAGAIIYYTTDGSTPTTGSTEYTTGTIAVSATSTLKFFAVKAGLTDSDVSTYNYVIGEGEADPDDVPVTPSSDFTLVALPETYSNRMRKIVRITPSATDIKAEFGLDDGSVLGRSLTIGTRINGGVFEALNNGVWEAANVVNVTAAAWLVETTLSPGTYRVRVRPEAGGEWVVIADDYARPARPADRPITSSAFRAIEGSFDAGSVSTNEIRLMGGAAAP